MHLSKIIVSEYFTTTAILQLTTEQRIFIVKHYYWSYSPIKTKREFASKFNKSINIKTVKRVFDKWTRNGAISESEQGKLWTAEICNDSRKHHFY